MARMHFVRLCAVFLFFAGQLAAQDRKLALSPSSGQPGSMVQVTVLSSLLEDKGASISFEPGGALTVSSLQMLNRQLHFMVSISPNAKPGPYTLVYTRIATANALAPVRFDNVFFVLEPPKIVRVAVRSITPSVVVAGGAPVNVTITGTGFQPGAKVAFLTGGVQATTTGANSQQITATLTARSTTEIADYAFVIRNPDGSSNTDQSPLPVVHVVPQAPTPTTTMPSAPPLTDPPPTTPPPAAPVPSPPSTPPPPEAPPATAPPTIPPPPAPPTTSPAPPVIAPPVTPPPIAPPAPSPAPDEPKPPSKPSEVKLLAPRVDVVRPSEVAPGEMYTLELEGRNLGLDTKLSFGDSITIVGAPVFSSPTRGSALVLVGTGAKPGPAIAVAQNPSGSNSGPGATYISMRATNSIHFVEPLIAAEVIKFRWRETTPGLAKFYLFEVIDAENKILYSAQTKQTSLSVPRDRIAFDETAYARVKGYADQNTIAETSELQLISH